MNKLLVSRKFRTRIIEKICTSFPEEVSSRLSSLAESFMTDGISPDLSNVDQMTACVFNYIAQEISVAIERSRKARERAASRKTQSNKANNVCEDNLPPIPEGMLCFGVMEAAQDADFNPDKLKMQVSAKDYPNRQQRRRANRLLRKRMTVDKYGRILGQAKYCGDFMNGGKEKVKVEIV